MPSLSLLRQGKFLEYATLCWNIIGVVVIFNIAPMVHSVALIGFGFDSLLEIGASIIVLWELNENVGKRRKRALQLLSISFFSLGVYILIQNIFKLLDHTIANQSNAGICWLALTFIVMLVLALRKHQIGRLLNNQVLLTESRVTLVDAGLAFVVLTSMFISRWLSWQWADATGSSILMIYCFWESFHAWQDSQK